MECHFKEESLPRMTAADCFFRILITNCWNNIKNQVQHTTTASSGESISWIDDRLINIFGYDFWKYLPFAVCECKYFVDNV